MGKSSSQVVGYRYYAKFAAFIGNRIEKLIGINFDNRKWVIHDPLKHPPNLLPVLEGNLFGENEGGVSGNVDIHFGYPNQEPNTEYQKYFPLVSGYPYQSYLVFRSLTGGAPSLGEGLSPAGFYLGNSGYMKEMLLWVKRTRVRNDGRGQWYEVRGDGAVVCEIDAYEYSSYTQTNTIAPFSKNFQNIRTTLGEDVYITSLINYDGQTDILLIDSITRFDITGGGGGEGIINPITTEYFLEHSDDAIVRVYGTAYALGDNVSIVGASGSAIISGNSSIDELPDNIKKITFDYMMLLNGKAGIKINIGNAITFKSGGYDNWAAGISPGGSISYVIKKRGSSLDIDAFDINPIHKIREILTDDTAMNKPESDINDVNFKKAADRIWDEGLGVSWSIDEKSCIDAIEELCYHIEAGIRVNRQTGLYEMVLFRDDWFAEDEIHTIAENKIKDLSLEVMNSDDIVNQLNVTYYDRERIKNSTFSIYENGSILTMGHTNAESVDFPYFMNMRNAEVVANWKLKQFSTPAWSGSFTTGWREARKWNRYDLVRLPWSSKWNGTILARIIKINLGNGTDNTVTIDFEEVIPYSREMNTSIVVDSPVDAGPQPPQPSINAVFEAPYYLTVLRAGQTNTDLELSNNPEIGYVAAIAAKPQSNSLNALLYTDGGIGEFEQVSRLDYCDILQLDQPITETTSSFVVTGSLTQTANSNNLILLNRELMGFVSFDDVTRVLTVKRGALDTVPKKHSSGSLFVFDLPDVAFDSTQYAQGEVVEAQVLTTTPSGIQDLLETEQSIEIKSRAIRPYPPANVKINGEYWPETHIITNDIVLTWGDRNRLQQTGGGFLGFFDTGVTVESGVTYSYELICENVVLDSASGLSANTASILASALVPNKPHTLKLWSVREDFESYQTFEHSFFVESVTLILSATVAKDNVIGSTIPTANMTVNVDESLSANMLYDGSSINGKAIVGSTITIEVI